MKSVEQAYKKIIVEYQTCLNCKYWEKEKCLNKIYNADKIKKFGCNLFNRKMEK